MTDELDCIFGLGIPKFANDKCEKPSDPALDKEEMKELSQAYKVSKMQALAKNFDTEFPDYFINIADNKLLVQKFHDINYA